MKIKRRAESFFGLHFDFHARPRDNKKHIMGENLKAEDIRKICTEIKPDFIQIDCKGHPGYASYPSKLGNAMPDFALDTLALWRKVTAEEGVALYVHYSGVYDAKYLAEHPREGVKKADGTYSDTDTSTFGNYCDDLLIPQFLEIASYGVDGAWVDGECWATKVDYCDKALAEFKEKTGVDLKDNPPYTKEHPYYNEYRDFCRDKYRWHLTKYINAVHEKYPNFQFASNWAYSEQMPEAVTTPVDFLSGDYAPYDSLNSSEFSARIFASQDKPWDLMSWGFRQEWDEFSTHTNKTAIQLMQEAAGVISLGGSYQTYIMQRRDTSPKMNCILQLKPLSEFCRERESICKDIKSIPQTVLFNSTLDHYRASPYIFSNGDAYESIKGWSKLLCRAGHSFDIREEHNLFPIIDDFKMVVVPEAQSYFEEETIEKLIDYAKRGGILVVTGLKNSEVFAKFVDAKIGELATTQNSNLSVDGDFWSAIQGGYRAVNGGKALAYASITEDVSENVDTLMAEFPLGRGKMVIIGANIGEYYNKRRTVTSRKIAEKLLDMYTPVARVKNTRLIDINVARKQEKLYIHLVNTAGVHGDDKDGNFDEIPPLYNIEVELNLEAAPNKITLKPEGTALNYKKNGNSYTVTVPKLEIHSAIEIE